MGALMTIVRYRTVGRFGLTQIQQLCCLAKWRGRVAERKAGYQRYLVLLVPRVPQVPPTWYLLPQKRNPLRPPLKGTGRDGVPELVRLLSISYVLSTNQMPSV